MTAQTILPANSVRGGDLVTNSLRFNTGSSDHLTRTNGGAGNRRRFTYSFWIKRSTLGTDQRVIEASTDNTGNEVDALEFTSDDIRIVHYHASGDSFSLVTDQKFRDPSAWMNIVVAFDTAQGTAANRVKLYVNGTRVTSFSTEDYPGQNYDNYFNNNNDEVYIGRRIDNGGSPSGEYFGGYLSEFVLIDGLALGPTSFGEFDEDSPTLWKPIDVSDLTFGTNGFYLQFKQAGTGTNISGMGADTSGNTNHFAVVNLTAVDQTTDTCTNNFSTLNPLYQQGDNAFSEGNCKVVLEAGDGTKGVASNIAVSSGKWYFEVKQGSSTNSVIQVREASDKEDDLSYYEGSYAGYQFTNGNQYITGNSSSAYGASYADGDIIMVALDMDNNRVYFGKNGSWNDGDGNADEANLNDYAPVNGVTDAIAAFGNANGSATATAEFNFGNPPYANSSSVSDGNGFGNFEFAVPSGYFAICTKNLASNG